MATVANITAYGAVEASANNSVAIQAAIDAVEADGGGVVYVPEGTWRCNVQVGDSVSIRGVGRLTSILKSVAGSNLDVIKGKHYATLTGTAPATPETAGDNGLHLSNLCIDGDRDNNTQGFGIRIWGLGHVWKNLLVRNCSQDGIRTEFSHEVSTYSGDWGVLEGDFNGIHTIHNDGNGWTFYGPHDSWLNNYVTYGNGGWGLESVTHVTNSDGVMHGTNWNSYLNTTGSYKLAATFNLGFVVASGVGGTGVSIEPGVANCTFGKLYVGGHATGLILRGAGHHIAAAFETCTTAVEFSVTTNCILDLTVDNSANVFTLTNDQGYHKIRAAIHLTGAQTLKTGSFGPGSSIDIKDSGALGNMLQLPVGTFLGEVATDKVLIVKGAGSQSAVLTEWQNSGGTAQASVSAGGDVSAPTFLPISTPGAGAYLALNSNIAQVIQRSTGATVLQVRGASGQTADLIELHNGTGVVGGVTVDGRLKLVAGNEATSASAGANGDVPAQVVGYFLIKDSAGTARKVPYYAT